MTSKPYGNPETDAAYHAFHDRQRVARINGGLQCPECYGVRTSHRQRLPHEPRAYECADCGCNWSDDYYRAA
jgi:hypothetical protein